MRPNATLARLRQNQPAIGLWLQLGSPVVARMLAAQGAYQWLLVDLEHTATDLATASQMMSFIADVSAGRVTPLARVPANTVFHIKQVLDAGAQGVMIPMVNTAEEARDAVRFSRYPPQGERGVGGFAPFIGFGTSRGEYTREANDNILVTVQIETQQAIANIDAIAAVPGLDVVFVGPNDLHISYGLTPRYWSDEPAFRGAIDRVLAACQAHNVPAGILCANAAEAKARIADGFTFVGVGSDANLLLRFAGLQAGEVTDTPEPAGGWAGVTRLDR
jgi:4-hydroxy-2-oxoheptanedioate aldolase